MDFVELVRSVNVLKDREILVETLDMKHFYEVYGSSEPSLYFESEVRIGKVLQSQVKEINKGEYVLYNHRIAPSLDKAEFVHPRYVLGKIDEIKNITFKGGLNMLGFKVKPIHPNILVAGLFYRDVKRGNIYISTKAYHGLLGIAYVLDIGTLDTEKFPDIKNGTFIIGNTGAASDIFPDVKVKILPAQSIFGVVDEIPSDMIGVDPYTYEFVSEVYGIDLESLGVVVED